MVVFRPIATNDPAELTVTETIVHAVVLPFMKAGVVQIDPSVEVAYIGPVLPRAA